MTAKTCNITIRMDKDLKQEAEELFADFGMSMTSAFNLFVRQSIRKQGIPFAIERNNLKMDAVAAIKEAKRIARDPKAKRYGCMAELVRDLDS